MQALATAFAVVRKDFRDFLRNRALVVSVLMPVILSTVFIRIAEQVRSTRVRVDLVVASPSQFPQRLEEFEAFRVERQATLEEATRRVEAGETDLALALPRGFDARIEAEDRPTITVIVRQDKGPIVAAGLAALVEMLRAYAQQEAPVELDLRTLGAEESVVRKGKLAGSWILFTLLVGFTVVASSLIEERERGTLQAILVTRAGPGAVLLGKGITGFVLCVVPAVCILALNGLVREPWSGAAAILAVGAAFVVGLGLWMGTLFPNMASANAGLSLVFLVLFVPVYLAEFPGAAWAADWIRLLPSHTLMEGLQRVLEQGLAVSAVQGSVVTLAAWSACAVLASVIGVRMAMESGT